MESRSGGKARATKLDDAALARFAERMRRERLPEIATRAFLRAVRFVAEGGATLIGESEIEPVESLPGLASLERHAEAGRRAAAKTAVVKLNGGLGTSMGLSKAKSLLPVRPGISFLDLIARQVLHQRARLAVDLPLVLMNSYRTRDDSLAALLVHPELEKQVPLDFVQHKVPRIDAASWRPVEWGADPELEWCPPGHGDLYIALASSGMLDILRSNGFRYAFVSNADNLGATLDLRILGWFASEGMPFAMEVAERTPADRKGGHLARRDGRLMLRETAQCADHDLPFFQDIARHHYFNTNNLWLDLDALAAALAASPDGLSLPIIRNEKRVSPTDPTSPSCYQLETAMGSAIECFDGAAAIAVPRERFAPVKTTNDLLVLWSDAYELAADARMLPREPDTRRTPIVDLDPRFYAQIADFEARFPDGAPALRDCRRLTIRGDFRFGSGVSVEGEVELVNPDTAQREIASEARLAG